MTIVLVLDASNNGTLTVNGVVLAGPAPKSRFPLAKPKKIKFALKGTGTATFVGPLKQTLQFTGKYGATDFTATGVFDLKSGNTLVLTLKFRFAKLTALGKVAAFSFEGKRS